MLRLVHGGVSAADQLVRVELLTVSARDAHAGLERDPRIGKEDVAPQRVGDAVRDAQRLVGRADSRADDQELVSPDASHDVAVNRDGDVGVSAATAVASTAVATATPGALAFTGKNLLNLTAFGAALSALGAVFVLIGRRRRVPSA